MAKRQESKHDDPMLQLSNSDPSPAPLQSSKFLENYEIREAARNQLYDAEVRRRQEEDAREAESAKLTEEREAKQQARSQRSQFPQIPPIKSIHDLNLLNMASSITPGQ